MGKISLVHVRNIAVSLSLDDYLTGAAPIGYGRREILDKVLERAAVDPDALPDHAKILLRPIGKNPYREYLYAAGASLLDGQEADAQRVAATRLSLLLGLPADDLDILYRILRDCAPMFSTLVAELNVSGARDCATLPIVPRGVARLYENYYQDFMCSKEEIPHHHTLHPGMIAAVTTMIYLEQMMTRARYREIWFHGPIGFCQLELWIPSDSEVTDRVALLNLCEEMRSLTLLAP